VRNTMVALAKIGLLLEVQFPNKGRKVVGVGVDAMAVEPVDGGREPLPGQAHLAGRLPEPGSRRQPAGDPGPRGRSASSHSGR
jgi:hypothetical protein